MKKSKNERSKYLALLLRHKPELAHLSLYEDGWVAVNELLNNTDFTLDELKEIVKSDQKGRYSFNSDFSKIIFALSLLKASYVRLTINNSYVETYPCDGIIVSTQTGSTAYSWSAGGPVIDPDLQCIMLTPICTHSPLNRSLVFNEDSIIRVKPVISSQKVCVSTDGEKTIELSPNSEIIISKSNCYAEFIRIKSDEFFDILNSKLSQRRI